MTLSTKAGQIITLPTVRHKGPFRSLEWKILSRSTCPTPQLWVLHARSSRKMVLAKWSLRANPHPRAFPVVVIPHPSVRNEPVCFLCGALSEGSCVARAVCWSELGKRCAEEYGSTIHCAFMVCRYVLSGGLCNE